MPDTDIERIHDLAERATHESVTPDKLAEKSPGLLTRSLHDDPLYNYLQDDEQPHFLFHADQKTPDFNGPSAPESIERSRRYKVWHLVTDRRWLMVAGNRSGDQLSQVLLEEIQSTNFSTDEGIISEVAANLFVIKLDDAHLRIPVSKKYSQEALDALSQYLRDEFDAIRGRAELDPEEAGFTAAGKDALEYGPEDVRGRLDRLPEEAKEEADDLVVEANDADELIEELDRLSEEYQEPEVSLDEQVQEASSVDELRRAVETPTETVKRRAFEHAEHGLEEAQKPSKRLTQRK